MAQNFTVQWNRAKAAAQAAGEAWVASHTQPAYLVKSGDCVVGSLLDFCGRAYVQTKLNTAFGRWCRAQNAQRGGGVDKWLHFGNALEYRQEMGLHEAMAGAALKSLNTDGIPGLSFYSWID